MTMYTAHDLVVLLKDKYNLKSNYAVAQFLQVSQRTVRLWDKHKGTLDESTAFIVAEKLGIDPSIIITSSHMEKALKRGDIQTAQTYAKILNRLAPLAVKAASAAGAYGALLTLTGCAGLF